MHWDHIVAGGNGGEAEAQPGMPQVGVPQIGITQIGPLQPGMTQPAPAEIGPPEVGVLELGVEQEYACGHGALQAEADIVGLVVGVELAPLPAARPHGQPTAAASHPHLELAATRGVIGQVVAQVIRWQNRVDVVGVGTARLSLRKSLAYGVVTSRGRAVPSVSVIRTV